MNKKILITGATGLIGRPLCSRLIEQGDQVKIFTRSAAETNISGVEIIEWDYHKPDGWAHHLEGMDAVIHLAGMNLFSSRWNDKVKARIMESRKISTGNLAAVINKLKSKPEVFINASGIGYYGDTGEAEITEYHPPGNDFLADVCKEWEVNATLVEQSGVRRISIRTGVGLHPKEGALKEMLLPFKLFIGGPLGSGKQWFSWVHLDDVVEAYIYALDNKMLQGPVNVTSPNPVRMDEFAHTLGRVMKRPSFFRVPPFVLKIVAGEAAEVVMMSQKVMPAKLEETGFRFKFPHLKDALMDLLKPTNL